MARCSPQPQTPWPCSACCRSGKPLGLKTRATAVAHLKKFCSPPLQRRGFSRANWEANPTVGTSVNLFSEHQRSRNQIVEGLLPFRERGHDVTDGEWNHSADNFREETAGGVAEGNALSLIIGYAQGHHRFSYRSLPRRAFH